MFGFSLFRKIIVIVLILSILFNYPLALGTFISDCVRTEDPQNLSSGSPWLDTDLSDNLTIFSESDPCEDFHLYAGKDLVLRKKYLESYELWNNYAEAAAEVDERAMKLLNDQDLDGHDAGVIYDMYDILSDWDKRNDVGFEEIKEFTEPILEAKTLDELTDYLLTEDGLIFLVNFIRVYVNTSYNDSQHYAVFIDPESLLIDDSAEYSEATEYGEMTASYNETMFTYYADRLGMDEKTAEDMLESAYDLERVLAPEIPSSEEMMNDEYIEEANNLMTFEELEELSVNYPLADIVEASNLKYDGAYIVSEPDYLKLLNEIYVEDNLEAIRSIVYIHALLDLGEYTDREAYDYELETSNDCFDTSFWYSDEESAYYSLQSLLSEPLQKIYVEEYGSEEDRKKLEQLCEDVIDCYREMLSDNDWASQETIDYAIEKLDAIKVRVAFPDEWTDYSELSVEGCSLFEAVSNIYRFYDALEDAKAGEKVDSDCWAYFVDTLDCNAYYSPAENSIYICMGMMEEPFYYENMSDEELYASVAGFWVGHEISHSFDAYGSRYDAEGNLRDWWSEEDKKIFREKIQKLDDYLDTIVPFGDYHVVGKSIDTEMLADITGLKCALKMAEKEPDFDYDVFFRKFALLNIALLYYSEELSTLLQDEHPLNYLRTNVAVQQFEEFYDTYDVKEGDAMYLAPEDRVAVW